MKTCNNAMAGADLGTRELRQHALVVEEIRELGAGKARSAGARVVTQRLIDSLLRRGEIEGYQHQAGERLYSDFHAAGKSQHMVMNLMGTGGGGRLPETTNSQAVAHKRLWEACDALSHLGRQLAVAVCIFDEQPSHVVQRFGFPARYGIHRFKEAMTDLARHYGIAPMAETAHLRMGEPVPGREERAAARKSGCFAKAY